MDSIAGGWYYHDAGRDVKWATQTALTRPVLKAFDDNRAAKAEQFDFSGSNIFDNHLIVGIPWLEKYRIFDYELKWETEIKW